ncbi:hypothetical protein KZ810_05665 [Sphingomonas sp. RHCKR47]|jgi:hypothetical protein|uniref:hypothetical protein n=1 Tax=Sphingomonas citricola TaxID=2862498 RepID=UPI001CA4E1A3|nr:hypothetical protein [Sphingomonas citricola]MBW6522979.1 hypothetical protein [Sphingomonas citricola]
MRAIITKVLTGSALAAAALAVSACGSKTETTTDNTMITDMNATEGMDTMSDNMTAVDGSMNGGMMANDTMGAGMGGNDMMMSNTMTTTTTTNAM